MRLALASLLIALAGTSCVVTGDKKPTSRPSGMSERQAAAMRDPFNYGGNTENVDISGGNLNELNRDAFKRDMDHVLNP